MDITQLTNDLLLEIKKGKKYRSISDEIILSEISSYLRSNTKISKMDKLSVKEIRSRLHRLYASYQTSQKKKLERYLDELVIAIKNNNNDSINNINYKLLTLVVSTKERIDNYKTIYKKIFEITNKPKSIIDLGCGLNPLSYSYMGLSKLRYYSYDINEDDINSLNRYFKIMSPLGLDGYAKLINARNLESLDSLPEVDIIFIWKLIDLLNTKDHKPSEELIKLLIQKSDFIVASFSTRTLSGRPMNLPFRRGFELMLDRINLSFKIIQTRNEIFYVISKK